MIAHPENTFDSLPASQQEDITAVGELVSARIGCGVVYRRSVPVGQINESTRPRRYTAHEFSIDKAGGKTISVFVKSGLHHRLWGQLENLHLFLSELQIPEFRVPSYFGCLNSGHRDRMRIVGIWEFVPNDGSRQRLRHWTKALEKVARAAAAITALTEEARRRAPGVRSRPVFLKPLAQSVEEAIANFSRKGSDVETLRGKAARLASIESTALERLESLGQYLTHNDYRPANVFLHDEDRPVIYDWDDTSWGPPGATLRFMARGTQEEGSETVRLYCDHLKSKGFNFVQTDVEFAMRAMAIFHSLSLGCSISDGSTTNWREDTLRWALENLDYIAT